MSDTPQQNDPGLSPARKIFHILFLAAAVLLLPTGIACLLSGFFGIGKEQTTQPTAPVIQIPKHLADLSDNPTELDALRLEMRKQGLPIDNINLRIWASRAANPEQLFCIPPPRQGHVWNWKLSGNGLLALAYTRDKDAKGHRIVGLYDLVKEQWNWQKEISWPANCDRPQPIPGYLLVRYFLNGKSFVMEVDPSGVITTIEPVGKGNPPPPKAVQQDPRIPFRQFERVNGISFASSENGDLLGYAATSLPGIFPLKDAEPRFTAMSGNGRIQFVIENEMLHLYDPISNVSLADFTLFRPEEKLTVQSITADRDGAYAQIHLRSTAENSDQQMIQVSIDVLKNQIARKNITSDPSAAASRQTKCLFGNKAWSIDLSKPQWILIQTTQPLPSTIARIPTLLFSKEGDLHQVKTLEDDRHVVLRRGVKSWLLDLDTARHYADKIANLKNGKRELSAELNARFALQEAKMKACQSPLTTEEDWMKLTNGVILAELEEQSSPTPAPAYAALRTDVYRMNQLWAFSLANMLAVEKMQQKDHRAPRINPFVLARIAGHEKDWKTVLHACRELQMGLMYSSNNPQTEQKDGDNELKMVQFQTFRTLRGSTGK